MKKLFIMIMSIGVFTGSITVFSKTLETDKIQSIHEFSGFTVATTAEGQYLLDGQKEILGGPYKMVSDYMDFPYAENIDGSLELYDMDGTILARVGKGGGISPPKNGLYAIYDSDNWDLCKKFELYDYKTKKLIHTFDGTIMYYHELQHEKMFIKKNGKYAICDKYGNFHTDYIYDDVQKRFNPDYVPFPKAYAVVEQDGVQKFIDWDLSEINLDDYKGEPFITNSYRMRGNDGIEKYKNYYMLESGSKFALYDLDKEKFIIPYQYEYQFLCMNDKYIIAKQGENNWGVLDHSGNVVVPFRNGKFSFTKDGLISYYYSDGETEHTGVLNPKSGVKEETPLGDRGYFYKVLGETEKENIVFGTIVYENNRAADISGEDLRAFLDVYWNFDYEKVISPLRPSVTEDYYIRLWNSDKTSSYTIFANSGIAVGSYGTPTQSHGKLKENYVWYMPVVGNGRNALYTANNNLYQKYEDSTRAVTDEDKYILPKSDKNLLVTDGCSQWAEPEIQRAAAVNLMLDELSDKYTKNITRADFCKLAYRYIATEYSPESDSRMGIFSTMENVIYEKGLTNNIGKVIFEDCNETSVNSLAAAGIIEGMGDGTFAPDSFITREQAATILHRLARFLNKGIPTKISLEYSDKNSISDWAKDAVAVISEMGVMKGVGYNVFSPQGTYTVEQAIATMTRLYEK